ncbi:hypothetical protein HY468_00835 [Candidatus Roizmanbacteria bacterium]|nr:hypothetical protein [Candidatus Roizmanbacteria bacterium]
MRKIVVFLLLLMLLRIPSLFEPYWYGDEGITLTVGQSLGKGFVLYRDIVDNKPPLLYLLTWLFPTLTALKAITLFVSALSFVYFVKVSKQLFGSVPNSGVLLLFILLVGTPLLEANIVNGEIVMILPTLMSFYYFFQKRYVIAGVLAGLSTLIKIPSVFDFVGLLIWFVYTSDIRRLKRMGMRLVEVIGGFCIPWGIVSVLLLIVGGFWPMVQQVFIHNFFYSTTWQLLIDSKLLLLIKWSALILLVGYLWKHRSPLHKAEHFILLYVAFSLFGATLSNRPYLHYLIQIVPAMCLLLTAITVGKSKIKGVAGIILTTVLLFVLVQFIGNPLYGISYLARYYTQFTNSSFFGQEVAVTHEVVSYLQTYTLPDERVFVWSNNTSIYALSSRMPATRYIAVYHMLERPDALGEVRATLEKQPPRIIVVTKPVVYEWDWLSENFLMRYNLLRDSAAYQIYEYES